MLLRIDSQSRLATRVAGRRLKDFGFDEHGLQDTLYRSLDRLLPDEELLLVSQSRRWQEEPDLLAIDEQGKLYIFEIKVWESRSENLLQVLRYGQIFGTRDYDALDYLFRKFRQDGRSLVDAHRATSGTSLNKAKFNHSQVFVIVTNGLDFQTRQACQYWRSLGLDVRPWVYRLYPDRTGSFFLEISRFAVQDNPYEDITASFYMLNTNYTNDPVDHYDMIKNRKAAAYFDPWKYKIDRLSKGDTVFLYQSGVGVLAMGKASGKLQKAPYQGDPNHSDEEHFMTLDSFQPVNPPLSASEIKKITETNYVFRGTMFSMDEESANKLLDHVRNRPAL